MSENVASPVTLFLCGDVMTGRGIDQILPHPGDPTLHESCIRDARAYVELAEEVNGPVRQPVTFDYIWGDALEELDRAQVDVRIVNLETSITRSQSHWPGKGIHYRMSPDNVGCLTAARIDCCSLANNHVLDWGYEGLEETLRTLDQAGISHAGAGLNASASAEPAVMNVPGKGRVLVFSYGFPTSGIPWDWAATSTRPGVNLLPDTSGDTAQRIAADIRTFKREGDVVVASLHWDANWGYGLSEEQIRFAHQLIDSGVSIVHGHSSHHVKAVEVHGKGLVLYGCGDFLNDYEGISGYESYRSDLTLLYLVAVEPRSGRVTETRLTPMQMRHLQLRHAICSDIGWLRDRLSCLGNPLNTAVDLRPDGSLVPSAIGGAVFR